MHTSTSTRGKLRTEVSILLAGLHPKRPAAIYPGDLTAVRRDPCTRLPDAIIDYQQWLQRCPDGPSWH